MKFKYLKKLKIILLYDTRTFKKRQMGSMFRNNEAYPVASGKINLRNGNMFKTPPDMSRILNDL